MKLRNLTRGLLGLMAVSIASFGYAAPKDAPKTKAGAKDVPAATPLDLPTLVVDSSPVTQGAKPGIVSSYADVVEPVQKAVVSVSSSKIVHQQLNPFLRQMLGDQAPADRDSKEEGLGSGVIISPDGYILTNNHVVEGADELKVTLTDDRDYTAKVIGADPKTDIAVIKIDATGLPTVVLSDSDKLRVGDVVFAIGNPLALGQTVTMGIVSAKGRSVGILQNVRGYEDFIQTDAAINMGNSGGALVDAKGRLVGINSAIISTSSGNIGIGLAVPINLAAAIMNSLIATGTVSRGYLGVDVGSMNADLAEEFGIKKNVKGVVITKVDEDTPAAKAGLKRKDVMVTIDGKSVGSRDELRLLVSQKLPGAVVKIAFFRDGKEEKVDVTLGTLPGEEVNQKAFLPGVEVTAITDELRGNNRIDDRINGVVVTDVDVKSPYYSRLETGMVIMQIHSTDVTDVAAAKALLHPGRNLLLVYFHGSINFLTIVVDPK